VTGPLLCAVSIDAFAHAATVKGSSSPHCEIIVSYADATNTPQKLFATNKRQLYRGNEDGSARRRITDCRRDCSMPAWSPDGRKIVYVQESENGNSVWLSDPDGKSPKMLVKSAFRHGAFWLPD